MERGSIARAALLGGLLCAVLNATPLLSSLNACCCLLVVLCGAFAGWVLRNDSAYSASTGRCAVAGAFSGVIGGLVGIPLAGVANRLAMGVPAIEKQIDDAMAMVRASAKGSGDLPPGFLESMENAYRAFFGLDFNAWTVIVTLFGATFFSFFGLLGGLIGAGIARPKAGAFVPPPTAGPVPPPPQPPPPPTDPWDSPYAGSAPPPDAPVVPQPPPPPPKPEWPDVPAEDPDASESGPIPPDELPRFPPRDPERRD